MCPEIKSYVLVKNSFQSLMLGIGVKGESNSRSEALYNLRSDS